ncbi:hypothetical protein C5167_025941 [Papaver somniferum]|uniref:Uncharacterized protein n=1 Tax=Papaver somniferum TaxID=3469 RepID=A0A4Y7JTY7_PAPSO|nr:hypothetical protein C5167_025941 [Papaver somniferum]
MAIYICFPAARKSVGGTRLKKILRNKGKGKSTYNIPEAAKKKVLMKANNSWKYKKTTLNVICDEALRNGIVVEFRNNALEGIKTRRLA